MLTLQQIGAVLSSARQSRGLTQEKLADLTGVSERTIQGVEAGTTPEIGHTKIARLLESVGMQFKITDLGPLPQFDEQPDPQPGTPRP